MPGARAAPMEAERAGIPVLPELDALDLVYGGRAKAAPCLVTYYPTPPLGSRCAEDPGTKP
eukprot:197228-Prorocentrum_minimum.AAC.1